MHENWPGDLQELQHTVRSLNKLLDLDLAIIEDAYQAEYAARLQRSERLAAIGQVAGGVAHELRSPLNVVKTSVYYLLNARNPSAEKNAEHLHRIEKHVIVADNTITALSNFAKLPAPNRAPFAIEQCVRDALDITPLPDTIHVAIDCPSSLPPALADIDQVRIVFANLIRNAREAMPQGGRLSVTVRAVDGGIEASVADTGMGIPPEQLSRVMEPLYSTKARGLGLGLSHRAGYSGEKRRPSARGQRVRQGQHLHRVLADGSHRGEPYLITASPSILVVDDEIDTCRNLSDILSDLGY